MTGCDAGMLRARVRAAMRIRLAVVLLLGASHAWAQPAPTEPPEAPATPSPSTEPPPEGAPPASSPLEQKPAAPPIAPAPQPATPVAPPASAPPVKDDPDNGFRFGSYGRVIAGTDLRGGKPEEIAIVAHPPRVVEA